MKYLKKFATEAEVEVDVNPNVILIEDTGNLIYNKPISNSYPNGVYIQHIDGKLYTTEEWTAKAFANADANGVAVISSECSFVVSLDYLSAGSVQWSSPIETIPDVLVTDTKSDAVNDFNGKSNTQKIIAATSSSAAQRCANFVFKNGAVGYLGAAGEWQKVCDNKSEVDDIFTLLGKNTISQYGAWTSTQQSLTYAWKTWWKTGGLISDYKGSNVPVYPFTTL